MDDPEYEQTKCVDFQASAYRQEVLLARWQGATSSHCYTNMSLVPDHCMWPATKFVLSYRMCVEMQ